MPVVSSSRDLEARHDGVLEVADPEEDPRVAALGELVVEVEDEVAVGLLVDDDVAPRTVRVKAVGLDILLGQGFALVRDPAALVDPSKIVVSSASAPRAPATTHARIIPARPAAVAIRMAVCLPSRTR